MDNTIREYQLSDKWIKDTARRYRNMGFHPFYSNCFTKSLGFARECKSNGADAKVVMGFGLSRRVLVPLLGWRITVPVLHFWGEINGKVIEAAGPVWRYGGFRKIEFKFTIVTLPCSLDFLKKDYV